MHIYHGTNPLATYPRIVGHEVAAEVIEIGSNVTKVAVGDHVSRKFDCGDRYDATDSRRRWIIKTSIN
ncbi:alcohol dehydrogenase catalytic domain-containing protein [Bacillus sp. N9]